MRSVRPAPFGQRTRFPALTAGRLPPRTTENGLYVAYPQFLDETVIGPCLALGLDRARSELKIGAAVRAAE